MKKKDHMSAGPHKAPGAKGRLSAFGELAVFTVLAAAVILALLEAGARVWLHFFAAPGQYRRYALYTDIPPGSRQWSPHHYLNFYPTPGYKRGALSHNSLGYRGREFPVKKPGGTRRIVALGGSTTYTSDVEDNESTFTAHLERVLRERYGYGDVEVINAGAGSYTSWESLINLEFRVLDLEPDLVIVYHGINDVQARFVGPAFYRGDNSGRRKQWRDPPVSVWDRSCFLRALKLRLHVSRQVVLGDFIDTAGSRYIWWDPSAGKMSDALEKNPPLYFVRNLRNMAAVAKEHDVRILFATWAYSPQIGDFASEPHYRQGFSENNEAVKEAARACGVPLFDFAGVMPQEKEYWKNGCHVNEKGALKKAELFAEFIHSGGLMEN